MERINSLTLSSHGNDNDRLRTLYSISQKLSNFKDVEESFTAIVSYAARCFPLLTAVLIEHWEKVPRTAVWCAPRASRGTVARALLNAKTSYSYLAGTTDSEVLDFLKDLSYENELSRNENSFLSDEVNINNYIILPLMVDNLPPFGALQFEGDITLDEKDLEFVNALTNLMSVALDRFYKTKKERSQEGNITSREDVLSSTSKVRDLEIERGLREDFVSLLIHDLKSPLAVIMGAAELISRRKDIPKSSLILSNMIVKKSNYVVKMINNLLDANKIRSGQKLALTLETICLNSLVLETVSELKLVHGDRFEVVADHRIETNCDINGIKRILENLCNNAIKYGSPVTPVKIILDESVAEVLLKVHNLGSVITPEEQKSIFQQYHRSREAMLGPSEGWGIGLTLVRGVAEAHGGRVEVESSKESGTVFIVKLPKKIPS